MKQTIQERIDRAIALKRSGRYNCAQAVLEVLKDQTGLDEETLHQLGSGFCAGMGNMEATCGALLAANMALGLAMKGQAVLPMSKKLIEGFQERSGAVRCRDLKQITDGKPLCPCEQCVSNAIRLYYETAETEHNRE